jgi:hypothetical protein
MQSDVRVNILPGFIAQKKCDGYLAFFTVFFYQSIDVM